MNPDIVMAINRGVAVGHSIFAIIDFARGDIFWVFASLGMAYLNGYMIYWVENRYK